MNKAVILLSGGMDSTTCLAFAHANNYECYALSFNYGQKHNAELIAASKIAKEFKIKKHEIINLDIGRLGGSALTDPHQKVPDYEDNNGIPITYVPARNTIMLSIALGWAEITGADSIFVGVSAVDYSWYPDCRPEYIDAFSKLANLATKKAIEGQKITIETPLIALSKAETIKLGVSLNVNYAQTVSCYKATATGLACGICASCHLRKKGFADAAINDQTRYIAQRSPHFLLT